MKYFQKTDSKNSVFPLPCPGSAVVGSVPHALAIFWWFRSKPVCPGWLVDPIAAVTPAVGAPGVLLHAEETAVTSPAGAPQPVAAADWVTCVSTAPPAPIHCSLLVRRDERTPVPSFELQIPPPPSSLFSSFIFKFIEHLQVNLKIAKWVFWR